jgi:hypothetical protein
MMLKSFNITNIKNPVFKCASESNIVGSLTV